MSVTPLFSGGFATAKFKPWGTPQCANYGQLNTAKNTFGNFFFDTSNVGAGYAAGRFDLPADPLKLTRCELLTIRTLDIGSDDYYSDMVYLPKGWTTGTNGFWGVEVAQLNWEGLWGSTIDLQAHPDHITLTMQSGVCANSQCQWDSNADSPGHPNLPPLYAIPRPMQLGVWHELVIHVHWATDATGVVEVWHRLRGQTAWTKTASLSGYPTVQVRADGSHPAYCADKIGAYRAQSTAPTSVWLDGFSRSQSFAGAAAYVP